MSKTTRIKNLTMFVGRQAKHIREGGVRVILDKAGRAVCRAALHVGAPAAVAWGIDWAQAEFFVGTQLVQKYKKARSCPQVDQALIKRIQDDIMACLGKYVARRPDLGNLQDWIDANRILDGMLWHRCQIKECFALQKRVAEVRQDVATTSQLDRLNMVFIPRAVALGAIGHYEFLCAFIQEEILSGRRITHKLMLLPPGSPVINPAFLSYWRQHVTIITDFRLIAMLEPLEKCLTVPITLSLRFGDSLLPSHLSYGLIRKRWQDENRAPLVALSSDDEARGLKCLESLGVPRGAWFVSLHVRSPGWRDNSSVSEDFRNSDIKTYMPAIESITAAGGWVIRLGDPGMKPLPPLPQVIDYAHSKAKSDWMDVFLCAKCKFFIGTSSGLSSWPVLFGVPVAFTNILPPFGIYSFTSRDLFLPRLCWSHTEGRYLNFQEFFTPPSGMGTAVGVYKMLNLEIRSNEAEDIKGLVQEMMARCDGTNVYAREDALAQKSFQAMASAPASLYGDDRITVHARIGRDFLRKYGELLRKGAAQHEKREG
jgi:putative glycosyltransferase (TIGR04372 family)